MAEPELNTPAATPKTSDPGSHAYADTGRIMRIGLWTLGFALGGFMLWAAFAPLDEGVPTQGMVSIDTKRKAVQHLQGGIVREVRVREGDHVTEGQVLMTLDTAVTRANYESIRQHYFSVRAMEGRLLAEQSGADQVRFHPDLIAARGDTVVQQQLATQELLFRSRREALSAAMSGVDAAIAGQKAQIEGNRAMIDQRERQRVLLNEQIKGMRDLVNEGYAPRNRQLELERSLADIEASLAELKSGVVRGERAIEELHQRARQQQQEYRKEVDSQLAEVRREVQADAEKLAAVTDELARTELRSPATGQVMGLSVQTVGGVIQPAQKLMDIVPERAVLLLETRIAPHLADAVHAGLAADVRFSAFAHSPQLVVDGKVVSVSHDLITEPETQMSYYLARVEITREGIKKLGGRSIQPGMPVEVIIKTGERSLLTYLLYPLVRRVAQSMKEE